MTTVVFLLEEPSARELLQGLLPRLLPEEVVVQYMIFEGKQDLEKRMAGRIRGWLLQDSHFVVLRDQDANPDCRAVKARLQALAVEAGRPLTLVRIACRELESWALGDWNAIGVAFEKPALAAQQRKAMYREPDLLANPVDEIRKYVPEYQKIDGARRLGRLLSPEHNLSRSFQAFCRGVQTLTGAPST